MSIKGFKVNNQIEKYDYEALDNLPDIDGSVMKKALDVSVTTSGTDNGVTFNNNGDGTWSLSGTASSSDPARKYFAHYPTSIPSWLDSTKTLFINFRASDNSKVHAVVGFYYNGSSTGAESVGIYEPSYVRIPDGITGIVILFFVAKGTEVNNVTVNEFDVMYASELDPVAYQLKNSFAASMLPSTFSRVDKGANLNSILDYPANFINVMASTEARTLLSEIGFPDNFSIGSDTTTVTIVGFSISSFSTQYLVMTVNGRYVYLGFHNRATGLNNWSDVKGSKRRIRVLNIGHSGGQDVLAYTPYVIERIAPDVEFDLGLAYLSSATIDMMYDRILDNTIKDIEFDYKDHTSATWVNSARNKSLADILAQGPWDVILFEQASYLESNWSSFKNLGKYIDTVTNWHRSAFGSKCKIGWLQVGPNPQRTGVTFEGVIDCIHKILRSTQVEFVIPAGTATRVNALTHPLLTAIGDEGNMMADVNGHLQEGIPVLVGSYVSAMKLLEVCGCGNRSVEGDAFWPTDDWVRNVIHSPGQNGTCVPSTPAADNPGVRQAAQKAAVAAIKYPERATKIDYPSIDLREWSDVYPDYEYPVLSHSGKKYVAFGDSVTKGSVWNPEPGETVAHVVKEEWKIPTRIAIATGMYPNYENKGIGSIGYIHKVDVDGTQANIVDLITSYDFEGVELVTIQAGANDRTVEGETTLGSRSSVAGDGSICGAIKTIINFFKENYPKVQVVFIQLTPSGIGANADVWTTRFRGWNLNEFDEEVSQICHDNHVGYVNWWECCYCNSWSTYNIGYSGTYGPNYSHPCADEDYIVLGDFIAGKVSSLFKGLS